MKFFIILLFLGCSTVIIEEVYDPNVLFIKPISQTITQKIFEKKPDYKIRKTSKKETHFTFSEIAFPDDFPKSNQAMLQQDLRILWSSEYNICIQNDGLPNFLEKQGIDAIIDTKISKNLSGYIIQQAVRDPISSFIFGSLDFQIDFSLEIDSKKIILYKKENQILPIRNESFATYKWINLPKPDKREALLNLAKMQEVEIRSSSIETLFSLNGKFIANLPISSIFVKEGEQTFSFQKSGFPKVDKDYLIRAGSKKIIYHEWDADLTNSSLRIISSPTKQKIRIDQAYFGFTEMIQNNLKPDLHKFELMDSRTNQQLAEVDFKLDPKVNISIFAPIQMRESFFLPWTPLWEDSLKLEDYRLEGSLVFLNSRSLKSNLLFPLNGSIDSAFFLASEIGESQISFQVFNDTDFLNLLSRAENITFFSNEFVQKKIFIYKTNSAQTLRPFKFVFNKNISRISLFLNQEKVFERKWDFRKLFRIEVSAMSEQGAKIPALHYIQFEPSKEK